MDQYAARAALELAMNRFYVAGAAYALLTGNASGKMIVDYDIVLSETGFHALPRDSDRPGGISRTITFNRPTAEDEALALLELAFQKVLSDAVEAVSSFARARNEWHDLKKEPWFAFARHLRNAYSHNGKWHFADGAPLPVTWRRHSIERSMQGTPVRGFISYYHGTELMAQMIHYVTGLVDFRQQSIPRPED